ncbi:MAG: FliH/SctL family protein [Candidatus Sericytochromatia bacterium]|nr:FliH/SctL family protein [Candidatus Sericytochromatia bacterium]
MNRPKIIKLSSFEDGSYTIKAPGPSEAKPYGPTAPRSPDPRLAGAQDRASQIVAVAEADAEAIRAAATEEGRRRGHAEGYAAGLEEAKAAVFGEYGRLLESLARAEAGYVADVAGREAALSQQLARLSVAIASKLLAVELAHGREAAVPLARVAIKHLTEKTQVRLRVHPLDMQTMVGAKQQLMLSVDGLAQLDLVADPAVGLGGCLIETRSGLIDARLSTQLAEVASELLEVELGIEDGPGLDPVVAAAVRALGSSGLLAAAEAAPSMPAYELPGRQDAAALAEAEARARQIVAAAEAQAAAMLTQAEAEARAIQAAHQAQPPGGPAAPAPAPAVVVASPAARKPAAARPAPQPAKAAVPEGPLPNEKLDEIVQGARTPVVAEGLLATKPKPAEKEPDIEQATSSLKRLLGKGKPKPSRPW